MISIESIVQVKNASTFTIPILNVTCLNCKTRWSHSCYEGAIICNQCKDEIQMERAIELFVKKILMYRRAA